MTDPAKEPEVQTMTAFGKALATDDSTALLLGLLGLFARRIWNAALWNTTNVWSAMGKIPTYPEFLLALKQEHPLWYRRRHPQRAQAILEELRQSCQSWFAFRRRPGYDHQRGNHRKLRRGWTYHAGDEGAILLYQGGMTEASRL